MDWLIGVDARTGTPHPAQQMHAALDLTLRAHQSPANDAPLRVLSDDAATLAANPRVLAILAPFRSADTAAALPAINRYGAPLVSPSNTYVPLTSRAPSFEPDEPERYYAHGPRTYVRLFPNDFHQAAALVQVATSLGVQRAFVVHDDAPYGLAIAEGFTRAASAAGLSSAGVACWKEDLLDQLARAGADALVLCGVPDERSQQLLADIVRRVGPNDELKLFGSDAFLTGEPLGATAADMVVLAPGVRPGYLPATAEEFVDRLAAHLGIARVSVEPYALHAAEATALLLEAIDSVGFSRPSLVRRLFDGTRHVGMLGGYTVLPTGDIAAEDSPILGFSVYRASRAGEFFLEQSVVPGPQLVSAAFA